MGNIIAQEMALLGYTDKVGDIFLNWETVKDELLEPDRKTGTGNGTIHVFLGKEGYKLFQNQFPEYFEYVKSTNETASNAPHIKHIFSKANLISSVGHVCNYYVQKGETEKVIDLVTKVATKLNESSEKYFISDSLFKWSTGSGDLRPYFKQFDEGFQKTIRPLLLPKSAYKISLFKNKDNECAAFWMIGFDGLSDFEVVADIVSLRNTPDSCLCKAKKLTDFILKCVECFRDQDDLNSIVPFAADVAANNPIKVSKEGSFSLVGMFLESDIDEINKRNAQHSRWFENSFSLGDRTVYLSTQWNASGNYQLTLSDFEKLIKTCYGDNYYYRLGQSGEHELWIKGSFPSAISNKCGLPLQTIYYGAPGTGKSHKIDRQTTDNNSIRTTFHPDTDYATFVGAYKPMMEAVDEYALDATGKTHQVVYPNGKKSIAYKFEPQVFLKAYVEAWKRYLNKQEGEDDIYYLVIEEINRGNCAQIFGDLFQLLDREDSGYSSYAISPESAIIKYLAEEAQSADGTKFSGLEFSDVTKVRDGAKKIIATADDLKEGKRLVLPPNLHIWATMNTSDQSLFPIDSAFKRRWDWEYMPIKRADTKPENKWTIRVTHDGKTYWCYWWEFLEAINHQIEETTHSEDKQLGYFFAKPTAGKNFISTDTFVNKVIFYLWNDVFKDEDSAVFQYDNDKVEDVSIGRSGAMYFRHFMEKKDEMIHYFINQLFAMGKDNNPVVPIDYLKYDNNPKVIEHLPKMREDTEEAPEAEENDDDDGKVKRNTDKYIVDGAEEQIYKKQLLEKIVRKQLEKNPNITNEKLKEDWKDISLNSQPCILNDEEYQELISNKTSYEGRYNQIEGRGIWVNNQIGGAENTSKIIKKAQSLGITVEIVGK